MQLILDISGRSIKSREDSTRLAVGGSHCVMLATTGQAEERKHSPGAQTHGVQIPLRNQVRQIYSCPGH